jgi:hypothetical protein
MPFRLVDDKIVIQVEVNGGRQQDFILDTGSKRRSSRARPRSAANISADHLHAERGRRRGRLRGLQLSRIDRLDVGDLQVRNLPVLIKNPALRGLPKREGRAFRRCRSDVDAD